MFSGSLSSFIWPGASASAGFNPTDPLYYPSLEQQKKNAKHGIFGGSGVGKGFISSSYLGSASATEFFSGVDVSALAVGVWKHGFILYSKKPWYRPSLFWTTGSPLGGRVVSGSPIIYSGVRAVRPDCASRVHYFADTIDFTTDDRAECPSCHNFYPVSNIPRSCTCGYPMISW
jgi:hypothetical protein